MSEEEYKKILEEYDTFIKIYKEFSDSISENMIDRIIICRDNFKYCYENNIKVNKRARCKTRYCPICNRKIKGKKFFEIKKIIGSFDEKYSVLMLTLNGRNVEWNAEEIRKEIKDNNEKFEKLKRKKFFRKVVRHYLKVTEIKFNDIGNDVCPHLHIILFVIKGIYKHTNIGKMNEDIKNEWNTYKQCNVNVFLKGISVKNFNEEKTSKVISYLTTSKKKRLIELFGEDTEKLKIYFESTKNVRLYTWGCIQV